jgi:hypothetical protein
MTFIILLITTASFGQMKELKGILTARNGDAIAGCNVLVKGQTTSVNTQACGDFTIMIPDNYVGTLVFSCLAPRVWEIQLKKLKYTDDVIIVLNDWSEFEEGLCDKNFKGEKRIKIK